MMRSDDKHQRLLSVLPAPHMHGPFSTCGIMLDVIIALLPLLLWACYIFGMRSLTVTAVSVAACVLIELLFTLVRRQKATITDLSAVVTGMLLAYNLPHTIPLWMPIIGAFFSIVIVKMLFGGLGKNVVNPALAGRACMLLSFSTAMTVPPVITRLGFFESYLPSDGLSGATPLSALLTPAKDGIGKVKPEDLLDMFIGNESGTIGEVSALLILAGLLYLLIRKVISWHIPVSYLGTVALLTFFLPAKGFDRFDYLYTLAHLCSGGLMLAAVFMATDYVTCP
ncbi:MAG: RnfABCDGE type electron transport complex subunit D, partial [Clostridia bacterium]|nr:RnfABCDGE type electron transport complex subunit D [Clostridia bacterium]